MDFVTKTKKKIKKFGKGGGRPPALFLYPHSGRGGRPRFLYIGAGHGGRLPPLLYGVTRPNANQCAFCLLL